MKKALDFFRRLEWVLLVLPMAALCVLIVVNIVMRAFFHSGLSWLEESSRYIFVFSTFLGASIAIETDQHPKMTALVDNTPAKVSQVLVVIGNLFCCALFFVVAFYGYRQIQKMLVNGALASSVPIPMWVPYLIIPLGTLVGGIRYLCLTVMSVKKLFTPASAIEKKNEEGGAQS